MAIRQCISSKECEKNELSEDKLQEIKKMRLSFIIKEMQNQN